MRPPMGKPDRKNSGKVLIKSDEPGMIHQGSLVKENF
jgi:hypothetical protein